MSKCVYIILGHSVYIIDATSVFSEEESRFSCILYFNFLL